MKKYLLLIYFLFIPLLGWGSTYYVDNSVGSSGDGSQGSPWKNLANINWSTLASNLPATVLVSGGAVSQTYTEALAIGASGTAGNYITIKAASDAEWSGHGGIVNLRIASNDVVTFGGRDYIVVDGFNIASTANSGFGIFIGGSAGNYATYITIKNCTIQNCHGFGIAGYYSSYITILNNIIGPENLDDSGGPEIDCIQFGPGSYWTIDGNTIFGSFPTSGTPHIDAIQISCDVGTMTGTVIKNNVFKECNSSMIITRGAETIGDLYIYNNIFEITGEGVGSDPNSWCPAIDFGAGYPNGHAHLYCYNNTFINCYNNGNRGVGVEARGYDATSSVDIRNNLFYNSSVFIDTSSWVAGNSNTAIDYNLYYNPVSGATTLVSVGVTNYTTLPFTPSGWSQKETNGVNTDPLMIHEHTTNGTDYNAHLSLGSPAIGEGVDLSSIFTTDKDGITRSSWDIGAYNYVMSNKYVVIRK